MKQRGHKMGWDVVLLAVLPLLLHWRSLDAGLFLDDFAILARLDAWHEEAPGATWWDLYVLGGFDPRLRFSGLLPWWTAEEVRVHFFRPIAASTHAVDVLLWRDRTWLMHLHSVAWLIAATLAARSLYGRISPRAATLAATVFTVSYVHAWPTGWIANRNALIALTFATLAIRAYLTARDAQRVPWLAGFWLMVAVLASESAVACLGYFAGYELTTGRTRPGRRVSGLALLAFIVIGWRLGYSSAGFGAIGSGTYIDPVHAPATFIRHAPGRLWLLVRDLASPSLGLSLAKSQQTVAELALGLLMAPVLLQGLRRDRRVWLIGTILSLIPLATSVPQPRLLGPAVLGLAPLVAATLSDLWCSSSRPRQLLAVLVALPHLVISPIVCGRIVPEAGLDDALPLGSPGRALGDLRGRNLIILDAPSLAIAQEVNSTRAREGLSTPAFTWILSVGEVSLFREGCCTIVAKDRRGMFRERWSALYRGPQVPFDVGDHIKTLAYDAEVIGVSEHGLATKVSFTFGGPLRRPQYVLARWDGQDFVRIRPKDLPRTERVQ